MATGRTHSRCSACGGAGGGGKGGLVDDFQSLYEIPNRKLARKGEEQDYGAAHEELSRLGTRLETSGGHDAFNLLDYATPEVSLAPHPSPSP